jgi:Fe2+ or Zn2+ uptake regulation protein
MATFAEHLAEDRRLVILRLLEQAPGYQLNASVLHSGLDRIGHDVSRDVLRTDLAWLAEQGLVTLDHLAEGVTVATLTERGLDAAHGRAIIPGVKRPAPGR